ncbi:MAG: transposon-encoded TnpW family protein [Clostridiales bacterium]|nr:transposon-encoded TnpW family protein [Clostridiales bacterium]
MPSLRRQTGYFYFTEVLLMDNTNTTTQEVPYIKRTIDGRTYTVKIHFNTETKETAKDKVKRLLTRELQSQRHAG